MAIYALGDQVPEIDSTAYVHPDAVIIGWVRIGPHSSVWPNAVLRGDDGEIRVGSRSACRTAACSTARRSIRPWSATSA